MINTVLSKCSVLDIFVVRDKEEEESNELMSITNEESNDGMEKTNTNDINASENELYKSDCESEAYDEKGFPFSKIPFR